jgi:3-oxoadipate enol-lactonase/3-oxoadipate enol-lactonase/4-carboxymuconolactone decarboxylase
MWDAQAAALRGEFRVLRLDRRGFGASSGTPSVDQDPADLWALCRARGLDRIALVGMSQGARAVLQFAVDYAASTSCIVLDGPPHFGAPVAAGGAHEVPYAHYCALAKTRGLAAFREEWQRHALIRLRTADPQAHALLARMLARYPGRDLTDTTPRPPASSPGKRLEAVTCPVLVVNGALEHESRKDSARQLARRLPRAEYLEIPDGGHLCAIDSPPEYNAALRRFLQQHAVASIAHRGFN